MSSRASLIFAVLAILFSISPSSRADTGQSPGSIHGWIRDRENSAPLSGAVVSITTADRDVLRQVTDEEGRFRFEGLTPGSVTLELDLPGYEWLERRAKVPAGEVLDLKIYLNPGTAALAPVEIIGRAVSGQQRVPGSATRIGLRAVRLLQPTGTQELVEKVPGVHGFADDGVGNARISVGIRGLNPRRSSRVLVLEDGVPIQPALYVYSNMYYNPPAERIDAVEVIKGSAAITDGPQTMGGVINYVTRRPRHSPGGVLRLTGGDNGFLSVFGESGGWGSRNVRPEFQLLYKRGNGFRENNAFYQLNATSKVEADFGRDRELYLKANFNHENSEATYTGLTEYSFETDPTFNPKDDDLFTLYRFSVDAAYSSRVSPSVSHQTIAYVTYFDRRWWRENDVFVRASEYDPADPASIDPVPYFETGDLIRVGGGIDNFGILRTFYTLGLEHSYEFKHRTLGTSGALNVGARVHWERFIDDRKVGSTPDARDGVYFTEDPKTGEIDIVGQSQHYEAMALAAFVSDTWHRGSLAVRPGLRFEVFEQSRVDRLRGSRLDDKVSMVVLPGLGLNYQLRPETHLFAGVHRGYTPPSSGTLRVVNFGQNADDGGLDVEAEKSWNYEVGARFEGRFASAEVTGFLLSIDDLVAAGRGTVFENLGEVETRGLEIAARLDGAQWHPALPGLDLSYTRMETEVVEGRIRSAVRAGDITVDISGNALPYAPKHQIQVSLERSFLDRKLKVRAGLKHVGRVFTDYENIETTFNRGDTGPIPAHTVFDASAIWSLGTRYEIQVSGKNLTDKIYIGSRLHSNPGQPEANASSGILVGPRRQINLGLAYEF